MHINQLVTEAHQAAVRKGWWANDNGQEVDRNPLELCALIHSEVSEAVEEFRIGSDPIYLKPDGKPEGAAIEFADVVIRIADFFGKRGWNLEEAIRLKLDYNESREQRHGGKKY